MGKRKKMGRRKKTFVLLYVIVSAITITGCSEKIQSETEEGSYVSQSVSMGNTEAPVPELGRVQSICVITITWQNQSKSRGWD